MATAWLWLMWFDVALWVGFLLYNAWDLAQTPRLTPVPADAGPTPPRVSILVPCRNEASRILRESIPSMLAQTWPNLEVVAVDDRSTDETGAILRELAAADPRLKVIVGDDPPEGWLGKTNALRQALAAASGEWVVGTDADILFAPETVATTMAAARQHQADLVTLVPGDCSHAPATTLIMPVVARMILFVWPPRAANNPRDQRALGCGGYLLMRREALERVGGYAAVAGQVVDDIGLATALKRSGSRLWCAFAPELIQTPMYRTLGELWQGFSKNILHGVGDNLWRAVGSMITITVTNLLPLLTVLGVGLALAAGAGPAWWPVFEVALLAAVLQIVAFVPAYWAYGASPWCIVAAPWAMAVMVGILGNAVYCALTGRRIAWRGRELPVGGSIR